MDKNTSLVLRKVAPSDSGIYKCLIRARAGGKNSEMQFRLNISGISLSINKQINTFCIMLYILYFGCCVILLWNSDTVLANCTKHTVSASFQYLNNYDFSVSNADKHYCSFCHLCAYFCWDNIDLFVSPDCVSTPLPINFVFSNTMFINGSWANISIPLTHGDDDSELFVFWGWVGVAVSKLVLSAVCIWVSISKCR